MVFLFPIHTADDDATRQFSRIQSASAMWIGQLHQKWLANSQFKHEFELFLPIRGSSDIFKSFIIAYVKSLS